MGIPQIKESVGYGSDLSEKQSTTLESIIDSLLYQLDRYSTITYDYEKVIDKLMPIPKPTPSVKETPPDPSGHLNKLDKLVDIFAFLNTENQKLINTFDKHI